MRIFPGWRAVGQAMLEARRRGVERSHDPDAWHGYEWVRNSADTVSVHVGQQCSFCVDMSGGGHLEAGDVDAATVLRVLAALDLIPAHLAAAEDERYGRCVKCDRTVRWWHEPPFTARWVHVQPWAVTGPAAHLAEVAS